MTSNQGQTRAYMQQTESPLSSAFLMRGVARQVVLVRDINLIISNEGEGYGSSLRSFNEFKDKLYFTANDGERGEELWVSDGTTAGTKLVADINPRIRDNGVAYGSQISDFTEFKDKLYFSANDGEHGSELWVSNGTTAGTQLLADINPGTSEYGYPFSSLVSSFTEFKDKLYFSAKDEEHGEELWVSDGTTTGTKLVADINPNVSDYGYVFGSEISNLIEFSGKLYFTADDGEHGNELWVSDGTTAGTQLLADVNPTVSDYGNPFSSRISNLTKFDDKLYFTADDGANGNELWVSNGTTAGTQLLIDINSNLGEYGEDGSYANSFIEFDDKLYFTADDGANGNELWVSDGTTEGTQLLIDINPGINNYGVNSSYAYGFTEFDDRLYFSANNGINGHELWVSDGTTKGTKLLVDIDPSVNNYGGGDSFANDFTELDDKLYFTAGEYGNREIWVTDGTTVGTQFIVDLNPGIKSSDKYGYDYGYGYAATNLTIVNNELFFSANDGETGSELYKLTFDDSIIEIKTITGTKDADRLLGSDENEEILGLKGDDTLAGKAGKDLLDGGADDDILFGSDGRDTLIGGHGNDLMRGQSGKDILDGGAGDDTLWGGNHFDRLNGNDGDDILDGGRGINTYNGGAGSDLFIIHDDAHTDWIQDFELGVDRIGLAGNLSFEQLEITGRSNSLIHYQGEQIGIILGVNPDGLDASNFE
ncbi:MAG: ELWxxDGT repeat protein [Cyanobacteria bacterium P01_G01_bin.67]